MSIFPEVQLHLRSFYEFRHLQREVYEWPRGLKVPVYITVEDP